MRIGKMKRILRRQAADRLPSPDLKSRIDRELFGTAETGRENARRPAGKAWIWGGAFAAAAVAAAVVLVVVFAVPSVRTPVPPHAGEPVSPAVSAEERRGTYAFTAVSSSVVLLKHGIGLPASAASGETDAILASINEYMPLMESLLGDGAAGAYETEASDLPEYAVKITARTGSLAGGTGNAITFYYTETEKTAEESELKGLIKTGRNVLYDTEGEISRRDGIEKISFVAGIKKGDRVEIKIETGANRREFKYEVYEKDIKVDKFKLSKKIEGGESELELKIEDGTGNEREIAFKTESEDGTEILTLEYEESGGTEAVWKVDVAVCAETGRKIYRYTCGEIETELDADDPFEDDERDEDADSPDDPDDPDESETPDSPDDPDDSETPDSPDDPDDPEDADE